MKFPKKIKQKLSVGLLIFLALSISFFTSIRSEPNCDNPQTGDLNYCIEKIGKEIDALKPAHEANKAELANLNKQVSNLKARINAISKSLDNLANEISQNELDLAYAKEIFGQKTSNYYKFIRTYDPVTPFIVSTDVSRAFREVFYQQKATEGDREFMDELATKLIKLKNDKEQLEKSKKELASAKASLDSRVSFLGAEVEKVEKYISELSSKQQAFIAQKLGSLNLPSSLGAGPLYCTDDRNLNPGFSPAFAFYTYGIPHRVGMNQYGAYGRASSGQTHEDILRAYFNNINFETKPNITITVDGYGAMPIETYLLGIYEMPGDWPIEALKAQAIAARSYAWSYTNGGARSICTSQKCQVYKGGNKGGAWEQAVRETAGKVITSGGEVATAWYASTAGGYTFTNSDVWGGGTVAWTKRMQDTASGVSSFSDLQNNAYDKASPCFYAAQGWRSEYAKSAWLKSEEVADIANAILLAKAGAPTDRLYPVDSGKGAWSMDEVKNELRSRGITPIESATSVSISGVDFGSGKTTQVTINGVSFSGDEFKNFFNLRAPANIQIVGPLYNVERK